MRVEQVTRYISDSGLICHTAEQAVATDIQKLFGWANTDEVEEIVKKRDNLRALLAQLDPADKPVDNNSNPFSHNMQAMLKALEKKDYEAAASHEHQAMLTIIYECKVVSAKARAFLANYISDWPRGC